MFVFSKVLDQLVRAFLLKINSIIDSSRDLPNYFLDNLIMTVSFSLKTFCSTTRNCVEYLSLGWTVKASLGVNHTTGIRITYPAGNYMFKVNNKNTRTRCEICSKLTTKIPERRQGIFTANFEHVSELALVFLLLALNM